MVDRIRCMTNLDVICSFLSLSKPQGKLYNYVPAYIYNYVANEISYYVHILDDFI